MSRVHALTPYLFVADVDAALSFYRTVFGAVELFRNTLPDGTVLFVELAVGDARLLVSEEVASLNALAPTTIGGSPVLLLETDDVDDLARRAVFAGGAVELPVREMFFGERLRRGRGPVRAPVGAVHAPRAAHPGRDQRPRTRGALTAGPVPGRRT